MWTRPAQGRKLAIQTESGGEVAIFFFFPFSPPETFQIIPARFTFSWPFHTCIIIPPHTQKNKIVELRTNVNRFSDFKKIYLFYKTGNGRNLLRRRQVFHACPKLRVDYSSSAYIRQPWLKVLVYPRHPASDSRLFCSSILHFHHPESRIYENKQTKKLVELYFHSRFNNVSIGATKIIVTRQATNRPKGPIDSMGAC